MRALCARGVRCGTGRVNGRLAMAESFIGQGSPDKGIRVLEEEHANSKGAANVSFMLGQALMHRGTPQDLNRAFEVFSTANLANLPRELVDPLTVGAVRALVRAGRFGEIDSYVARPEVADSPVMVATIKAYASLRQGQPPQAGSVPRRGRSGPPARRTPAPSQISWPTAA